MKDKDYEPFGPEWVKEMKKLSKDMLIAILRKTLIANVEATHRKTLKQ